jgi:hypothetical protein
VTLAAAARRPAARIAARRSALAARAVRASTIRGPLPLAVADGLREVANLLDERIGNAERRRQLVE